MYTVFPSVGIGQRGFQQKPCRVEFVYWVAQIRIYRVAVVGGFWVVGLLAGLPSTEAVLSELLLWQSLPGCPLEGGGEGDHHQTFHHPLSRGLSGDLDGKEMSVLLFENSENCAK